MSSHADEKAVHGYVGWEDGAAYCECGRTFESVQAFDAHIRRTLPGGGESRD